MIFANETTTNLRMTSSRSQQYIVLTLASRLWRVERVYTTCTPRNAACIRIIMLMNLQAQRSSFLYYCRILLKSMPTTVSCEVGPYPVQASTVSGYFIGLVLHPQDVLTFMGAATFGALIATISVFLYAFLDSWRSPLQPRIVVLKLFDRIL